MALEGHDYVGGGPVPVLGDDEVGFAGPGRLAFVRVLAVQQDDDVGILLEQLWTAIPSATKLWVPITVAS